jgi:hypothetical protein
VGAFIVRPFHTQDGIDFDLVERDLIDPVLDELAIAGRTTGEIARAGNIRTDMFEALLLADVVIADISIHNANVYYELGIRHALRDRITILIRAKADEVPFDLKTDRYLEYPPEDPGSAIPELREAILQSVREVRSDSPVYLLLPRLHPHDPATFSVVPSGFVEAVRLAEEDGERAMLAVLYEEIAPFDWVLSGRRLVGRAQFGLGAWIDAKECWEWVRSQRPADLEANLKLGTVYQRLRDFATSSVALDRVLERRDVPGAQRAEALALRGSNAKQRWIAAWRAAEHDDRRTVALGSPFLFEGLQNYDDGFSEDQNHFYSGINALSLTTTIERLADANPDAWAGRFATDEESLGERRRVEDRRRVLAAAVLRSLEAERYRMRQRGSEADSAWLEMTFAEYHLLTSDKPAYVRRSFDQAGAKLAAQRLPTDSAARQLRMYLQLDVQTDNARAGLEALGASEDDAAAIPVRTRVVVFSGHRVDAPGRPEPRFPGDRAEQARSMIRAAVERERAHADDASIEGIAGGANGGDILFHEVCAELGVPTTLLLALPPREFAARSVADGGPDWMERFRRLCDRIPPRVLQDSDDLPDWLAARDDYTVWQRNNLWILHSGLSREFADVTLVVLWNGRGGDGPGGTQDMVRIAERRGVKVVRLDTNELLPGESGGRP